MLFKRALLSHSMKWQSAFSIEHTSIIISNQGQQLIHHNPDARFETRIGDHFAARDGHCQVADIDAPRHGLIRISPQNLESLARSLGR